MNNYSDIYKIAKNYSKSLFELALEDDALDKVYTEFSDFYQLYTQSDELASVLNDRLLDCSLRQKIAEIIMTKSSGSKVFIKFVLLLISSSRIALISEIYASFQARVYKHNNLIEVAVVSESILSAKLEGNLIEVLEKQYNKTVKLTKDVDKGILGGFTLKVGSNLVDASLRNNINSLKESSKKIINNYLN
ncbi:MAG: ATP synthase F1 subunit delta [Rickettsiales bacterium]|jgi:F-type H+-transporting ATPase subunit delta|nr:ATP synthase F1 subunit delta [Rickettsiales bacterium]